MDIFLARVTGQAMNYAIRSGITITTTYALKQCGRLLQEAPRSQQREELLQLQFRLESKIRIISPAIDMIELIAARGNTSLESAVALTKDLRYGIQRLGLRLSEAANKEAVARQNSSRRPRSVQDTEAELASVITALKTLLIQIEDAVPLINLAITTSGANLSTTLSGTISPSRLLQASTFLTAADTKYAARPGRRQQVGPTWTLSLYMLFAGHTWRPVDDEGVRETIWKEVIHKARIKLIRLPLTQLYQRPGEEVTADPYHERFIPAEATTAEFAYQLSLVEDLDDDRVHTFDDNESPPSSVDEVANAGIRDVLPVHEISRIFYADTGKLLNIGGDSDTNNPVLLLRRDVHAEPPRRMLGRSQMEEHGYLDEAADKVLGEHRTAQSQIDRQLHSEAHPNVSSPINQSQIQKEDAWRLPPDLDPEWMALEVYIEEPDSADDSDESSESVASKNQYQPSPSPDLAGALSTLTLKVPLACGSPMPASGRSNSTQLPQASPIRSRSYRPHIKTSLSLLEMLLKLTALQQFRQESHLSIEDELINFFLEDSATAGAGPSKEYRQRLRHDAVRRVGFDPYDESPVKRRGEDYIAHARGEASPRPEFDPQAFGGAVAEAQYHDAMSPLGVLSSIEDALRSPGSPSPVSRPPIPCYTPSMRSTSVSTKSASDQKVQMRPSGSPHQHSSLHTPLSTMKGAAAGARARAE